MSLCDVLCQGQEAQSASEDSSSSDSSGSSSLHGEECLGEVEQQQHEEQGEEQDERQPDKQAIRRELQTREARKQHVRNAASRQAQAKESSQGEDVLPKRGTAAWYCKYFFTTIPYAGSDDRKYRSRAAFSAFQAFQDRLTNLLSGSVSLIVRITMDDVSRKLTDSDWGHTVFNLFNSRQRLQIDYEDARSIDIPIHTPSVVLDDACAETICAALSTWTVWYGGPAAEVE